MGRCYSPRKGGQVLEGGTLWLTSSDDCSGRELLAPGLQGLIGLSIPVTSLALLLSKFLSEEIVVALRAADWEN